MIPPNLPDRHTTRFRGYDYTSPGAYFITICSAKGIECFGRIHRHEMLLNPFGQIAHDCWMEIPNHHPHILLDEFVVMPNHAHGVLWITERIVPMAEAPRQFGGSIKGALSTIIGGYKAAVTLRAHQAGLIPASCSPWQGRFWDHIVRDDADLLRIQDYVRTNPARWLEDQLHLAAPPNRFNRW